jgi:transcriptional regulator GlxA family with amidase domain
LTCPSIGLDKNADIHVLTNTRWEDNGHIVSLAGISAGIDISLHLVARMVSNELAEKTARKMEFNWTKN